MPVPGTATESVLNAAAAFGEGAACVTVKASGACAGMAKVAPDTMSTTTVVASLPTPPYGPCGAGTGMATLVAPAGLTTNTANCAPIP